MFMFICDWLSSEAAAEQKNFYLFLINLLAAAAAK